MQAKWVKLDLMRSMPILFIHYGPLYEYKGLRYGTVIKYISVTNNRLLTTCILYFFQSGNQIQMATKDCVFLKMYEELYKIDYEPSKWYYNGGELPTMALLERYPGLAYVSEEGVQWGGR